MNIIVGISSTDSVLGIESLTTDAAMEAMEVMDANLLLDSWLS